jgi:hypothetical protein
MPLVEKLLAEVAVRNGRPGLHFSEEARKASGAYNGRETSVSYAM